MLGVGEMCFVQPDRAPGVATKKHGLSIVVIIIRSRSQVNRLTSSSALYSLINREIVSLQLKQIFVLLVMYYTV